MQTTQLALSFNFTAGVQVIRNLRTPLCARDEGSWDHRCSLSMHYLMLVHLFFECLDSPRLIFVEEDLEVAPDFFSYFQATVSLLQQDDSIFCISAWNDHGQRGRASNSTALLRTDVMPGLGWMLSADRARMVMPGWINSSTQQMGWDEYLRNPCVRNDMQCVFPEVSRTHTFGKVGTHGGIFFDDHFGNMVLNDEAIDWTKMVRLYGHC
jgi:alpha-1,3-mannosyl-glycoprotein beta-1,2-N-acetylglucosaminyltransferase